MFSSAFALAEEPKTLIRRAIAAQGGETLLSQAVAGQAKMTGNVVDPQNPNLALPIRQTLDFQMPDRFNLRLVTKLDDGTEESYTYVLNRQQAWIKPTYNYKQGEGWEIEAFKRECYAEFVRTLVPLLEDKTFNLESMGESKKNGRLVNEVKVTAKDKPEVRLYFDQTTGLLNGLEFVSIDTKNGKQTRFQRYFDDYRELYSVADDEKLLKAASLDNSPQGLLNFLHQYLPTREEQTKAKELVRKLTDPSFEVREKAKDDLIAKGTKVVGVLKDALKESDPEIVSRAKECLEKIGEAKDQGRLLAAIRVLGFSKSPEARDALLNLASAAVEEKLSAELAGAITVQAIRDGKADPRLEKALDAPDPHERAIAAAVLRREPKDTKLRARVRLFLPGLKWPMKETLFHGADKWADADTTEIVFYSNLADEVFAKP
jgi:hypothetical protein